MAGIGFLAAAIFLATVVAIIDIIQTEKIYQKQNKR